MELRAYAKINLILDLTGVLPDGYHAINTVMQSINLFDTVVAEIADGGIELSCSDATVPTDERNTAFKAARLFFDRAGIKGGVRLNIEKRIPHEAGLGGGSADAAAVLHALDEMFPSRLSENELLKIALEVGADVPFCFYGGTALCVNKGEVIAPLPDFRSWCVIAKPAAGVSTGKAFARFDSAENLRHPDVTRFVFYASRGEYRDAFLSASNIFEELTDVDGGEYIKRTLNENGAFFSSMSGSGSAYFGLFDERESAEKAAEKLRDGIPFVAVCETVGGKR